MQPITIYRPNQRHEHSLLHTWTVMALNVWRARELIWQLFKRDFFAQYKKSFLGVSWILLAPIAGIFSWVFLQLSGVLVPGEVGIPYPAYVLVGTSMWGLFIGLFHAASDTLESGKSLIMQVNYPHEAMLFKQAGQMLATFAITLILNATVLMILRVVQPEGFEITFPNWGLVFFPLTLIPLFLFASALGLIVAMIRVVAIDVHRIIAMGLGFLMFLTPIIYSVDTITNPISLAIIKWNPLTYLVCSARDVLIFGHVFQHNYTAYFIAAAISFILFMFSWRLFYVSEGQVVERMI